MLLKKINTFKKKCINVPYFAFSSRAVWGKSEKSKICRIKLNLMNSTKSLSCVALNYVFLNYSLKKEDTFHCSLGS